MPAGQFSKDPSVDRALRHSVRDGMAYSVQVGAGETYFSAFALFLNATAQQIALVSTLPQLLGSSAQIFSAWLGGYAGRRRVVLLGCALQALLWLPILLVPLLFRLYAVTGLLALLALYFSANNLAAPQWTSIMRDLVSERPRRRSDTRSRMMLVHCGAARLFALKYSASSASRPVTAYSRNKSGTSRIGNQSSAWSAQPKSTTRLRPA